MKSIAILLMVVAVCYGFEEECKGAHLKMVIEKCTASHGGDAALISDWIGKKEAHDETGKCFRACCLTECKYYNDEGKLNDDVPTRLAHILHGGDVSQIEAIEEAATKCQGLMEYKENVCNNTENWSRCVVEHCAGLDLGLVYD